MSRELKIVEAINEALSQGMERDSRVMVIGEDVGVEGGVFRVTSGLQEKFGKDRCVDTPLTETGILGSAVGLAINGMIPVCEIQFDGFIWPGFDHIINHISRFRTRTRGRITTPVIIRVPFGGGIHALEHHSESMEAVFSHIPGINVVIPSNPYDAKGLLLEALESPDPTIFLEPKKIYRAIKQEVPEEIYTVNNKKAQVLREGNDITIISYGAMLRETKLALSEYLNDKELDFELIDLVSLSPIDYETIIASAHKTGRVLIVNEEPRTCGLASELAAVIQEKCLLSLKAPIERVTGFDVIMPLLKMEELYIPGKKRILNGLNKVINF
jgi:pyruvate dehydrogenase E1 component beta subunit